MKTYILRRKGLGRSSVKGIIQFSKEGIEGYLNDGRKHVDNGYEKGEPPLDADLAIRWGCTSNLNTPNATIINNAKAIHWVSDKATSRMQFAINGLSPKTALCIQDFAEDMFFPAVVRPSTHAQGKNLDLCNTLEEVEAACNKYGEHYISKFIDKVEEYRVFILQGRVVWVAKKTPADPKAIAWNVAQGGSFENVKWGQWNLSMCNIAIKSFHMSGLDFGGVDIMIDKDGRSYVLEINSAPSQTSPYRQECCARAFDHLIKNFPERGKEHYEVGNNWQEFIHPGLLETQKVDA